MQKIAIIRDFFFFWFIQKFNIFFVKDKELAYFSYTYLLFNVQYNLACGDIDNIPNVVPSVEIINTQSKNLSIIKATCCHSILILSLLSCSAVRISFFSIVRLTFSKTFKNCISKFSIGFLIALWRFVIQLLLQWSFGEIPPFSQ